MNLLEPDLFSNGNTYIFCRSCRQIIALVPFHSVPYRITCPCCHGTHKVLWQKKWNGNITELKYRMTAARERSKAGVFMQLFYGMSKKPMLNLDVGRGQGCERLRFWGFNL